RWYLQTPEERTVPSLISVTPTVTRDAEDALSRDDATTWVSGVVCRFTWTDRFGITRTAKDSAGSPGKVLVRDFLNTPFPGPGIAAAMLNRRDGTGRTQTVTGITRWDATPGMSASLNLPGA